MSDSRNLRAIQIADPLLREIVQGILRRLDQLDLNGASLSIPALAIITTMIADGAVTTVKLAGSAVTLAKIAAGIFTADTDGRAPFAAGFINTALLLDGLLTADATGRAKMAAGFVTVAELATDAVETAKIKDGNVTKAKLEAGIIRAVVITGDVAGDLTVTGIAVGDSLTLVARLDREAVAADINLTSLTSEFSITGASTINNAAGTDTTGDALLVFWQDRT